jgi:hypothetical protein
MAPCVCGHSEADHGMSGRCHVRDCPCEQFEPMPQIPGAGPWDWMTLQRGRP